MTINSESGKITADKYTLNYISILAGEAADRFDERGVHAIAKEARDLHNLIYDELFKIGFYNS